MDHDDPKDILDPVVVVHIEGVPADCDNQKTHHVKNNGLFTTNRPTPRVTYKNVHVISVRITVDNNIIYTI